MTAPAGIDPLRFVARVTLELTSPMLIADGDAGRTEDQTFVRDVHALPLIPGTSLAGILRHGFTPKEKGLCALDLENMVFGVVARHQGTTQARGARLRVSDGVFHDASDTPVEQRFVDIGEDDVIACGRAGVLRDRVRIGPRGTADRHGKFDALHCPAGARFTFEMEFSWGSAHGSEEGGTDLALGERLWKALLMVFAHPLTRIGQGVRSGFGALKAIQIHEGVFWMPRCQCWQGLERPESARLGRDAYAALSSSLQEPAERLQPRELPNLAPDDVGRIELQDIKPEATWLFGGGTPTDSEDMAPVAEPVIAWQDDPTNRRGQVQQSAALATATGLKGALAHRTRWHLNRLAQHWLDGDAAGADPHALEAEFAALFGEVKGDGDAAEGHAGCLFFEDVRVTKSEDLSLVHNVQDRFTAGVRAGLLFEERVRYGGSFGSPAILVDLRPRNLMPSARVRRALHCALQDLGRGWLALGGGAGRGHGCFRAEIHADPAAAAWLDPEAEGQEG